MATEKTSPQDLESFPAGADLTTKQFRLVKLNDAGELVLAGAGDRAFPLQDKPAKGQNGTVAMAGAPKAEAGGEIKAGKPLSSNSEGKLVEATPTAVEAEKVTALGTAVIGYSLEPGVAGDILRYRANPAGGRA